MSKNGIDISEHQGANFDVSGNEFIMIRASWGHFSEDKCFKTNVAKCNNAGIPWGTYHYSYARSYDEAKSEAQQFLALVKMQAGRKYPLVVDIEDADHWKSGQGVTMNTEIQVIKAWKEVIEGAGEYLMLYCNLSYYNQLKALDEKLIASLDLWLAQWQVGQPSVDCGMWQHQGSPLDRNIAYKDYPSIINPKTTTPTPQPQPVQKTAKYKVGQKVKFSSCYYNSKDASTGNANLTVKNMTVWEGTISNIVWQGGTATYNLSGLCWVNDGDIRSVINGSTQRTYTVQSGDTLSSIASKFGTTYQKIASDNGIADVNKIYPGQVLKV